MADPIVDSECITPTPDPCPEGKDFQTAKMPVGVCCDAYEDIPQANRMQLVGIQGQCLYKFQPKDGFVVSTTAGQLVTNRPCIDIPYLKTYVTDPVTGQIVQNSEGQLMEEPPPCFDSLVIADDCGCQNRIQGQLNQAQTLRWDGTQFCMKNDYSEDLNPLIDPADVPIIEQECPLPLTAVLVLTSQKIVVKGKQETVYGYKLGGSRVSGEPIGIVNAWPGGNSQVPVGWMLCDGTPLDVDLHIDLFGVIGYAHGGAGNSFNLPDYRGRTLRGVDLGAGRDPDADLRTAMNTGGDTGNTVGSVQEDSMQCYKATYLKSFHYGRTIPITAGNTITIPSMTEGYTATDIVFAEGTCGEPRWSQETRSKNAYVNWIIKTGCPTIVES